VARGRFGAGDSWRNSHTLNLKRATASFAGDLGSWRWVSLELPIGWLTPFAILTGAGLIAGYGLLGACWLVLKTEGDLQQWARRKARQFAIGVAAFVAMVSVWTPVLQPQVRERWFGGSHLLWLWPVPLITFALFVLLWRSLASERHATPFLAALGIFAMAYSDFPKFERTIFTSDRRAPGTGPRR